MLAYIAMMHKCAVGLQSVNSLHATGHFIGLYVTLPLRHGPLTLWLPRFVNIIFVIELTSSNLNYYCLLLGPTALQNALREIP